MKTIELIKRNAKFSINTCSILNQVEQGFFIKLYFSCVEYIWFIQVHFVPMKKNSLHFIWQFNLIYYSVATVSTDIEFRLTVYACFIWLNTASVEGKLEFSAQQRSPLRKISVRLWVLRWLWMGVWMWVCRRWVWVYRWDALAWVSDK